MTQAIRRVVPFAVMLALIASVFGGPTRAALAQGQPGTAVPGSWQSSINLSNTGSAAATVQITFHGADGAVITTYSPSSTIPANGSLSIFVPATVTALPSGQYSAVVSSDQPVLATVNTSSTNSATAPWTAFGYEGINSASTGATLYFPGLYRDYFTFRSEMVIQNADTAAATLSVKFYNRTGAEIGTASLGSLGPNASKTFPLSTLTTTPALPTGNTAVFGAVVTSAEGRKLAGIANIWRTVAPSSTSSYNAVTAGSSTLYAPALYKGYFGFSSALSVQAVSAGGASGTITYSNGTTQNFTLAQNAAQEFYQPNNAALPSGNAAGVFSARVTTTSGQVIGLVSLDAPGTGKGDFASYNVPGAAATSVSIPNVLSDFYSNFSAVTVMNTGTTAANITITYATGQTRTFNNVPANGTVNIIHLNNAGDVLPDRTSTSAVVSSSNPLVAVVQHNTAPNVSGYNPAKLPSDFLIALSGTPR